MSYWEDLPTVHRLACGRVKFTEVQGRFTPSTKSFTTKFEAAKHVTEDKELITETLVSPNKWRYHLLQANRTIED